MLWPPKTRLSRKASTTRMRSVAPSCVSTATCAGFWSPPWAPWDRQPDAQPDWVLRRAFAAAPASPRAASGNPPCPRGAACRSPSSRLFPPCAKSPTLTWTRPACGPTMRMAKLPRSSLGRRGNSFPPRSSAKGMVRLAGTRAVTPNLCFDVTSSCAETIVRALPSTTYLFPLIEQACSQ
jgi:hypothetical protein